MFFKDVIGQEEVKHQLLASLKSGRVSHAQLFVGSTGYGTFALALAFAQYVFCTGNKADDSCGECPSCKHISKLIHSDLHFVFPVVRKKQTPVSDDYIKEWRNMVLKTPYFNMEDWYAAMGVEDNAQALIYTEESNSILKKLNLKSFESEYKMMIIWLPEKMQPECANKLLKIIEEPFEKTLFILVSEHPEQIINTILSRTQRTNIPPLEQHQIAKKLVEDKGVETGRAQELAHIAAGNWQVALRLLDESEEQIYNQDKFVALMRLCWERKMLPINKWVSDIAEQGRERQKSFLNHSLRMIRESFIQNFGRNEMNYTTEREKTFLNNFSPYINEANVIRLSEEFEKAHFDISRNGNSKIIFTDLAIKVMQNIRPQTTK
jgi:DNA polymerase-3 subunit delta'